MEATEKNQTLESKIIETAPVKWRLLQFIQHDEFKRFAPNEKEKLRQSITSKQFIDPFKVWREPGTGTLYCLDGFHRVLTLKALEREGLEIPDELPGTFIACANKKEAAELVLIYSSQYALITRKGFSEFAQMNDVIIEDMMVMANFATLEEYKGEILAPDPFDDNGVGVKNQYGVIVICKDEREQEKVYTGLTEQGYNCKIVVT